MENWNDGKYYLPECDDIYEVLGTLCISHVDAYYDGRGFLSKGEYLNARYWRTRREDKKKRYGRIDGGS